MPNYIYRARVCNDGRIRYCNNKREETIYTPGNNGTFSDTNKRKVADAKLLFTTITKYFTGKNPNITPQEQVMIRADIAKSRPPISGMTKSEYIDTTFNSTTSNSSEILDIYEGVDFVLKTFSDEASEGGKNITPNEVYQIYEIFHQWTK